MSTSHRPNPGFLLLTLALTVTLSTLLAAAHADRDPHYLPLVPSVKCLISVRELLNRCLVQTLYLQTTHSNFPLDTRCCNALKVAIKQCKKDEHLGINIPAFRVLSTFCDVQLPPPPPQGSEPGASPPQGSNPGASPPQGDESGASPPQSSRSGASPPQGGEPQTTTLPPQGGQAPTFPPSAPPTAESVELPASSLYTSPSASSPATPPLSPAAAPGRILLASTTAGEGTGATPPVSSTSPKTGSEISPVPSSSQSPSPGQPVNLP